MQLVALHCRVDTETLRVKYLGTLPVDAKRKFGVAAVNKINERKLRPTGSNQQYCCNGPSYVYW